MRQARRRFLVEWTLMFLLMPSAIVWLDSKPGLLEANAVLYDRILRERPPTPSNDILIVGIEKRTLDELGPWPFKRSVHAQLLNELSEHAPRAVFFDVFFDGPSADAAEDLSLADAMTRLPVYLPLNYSDTSPDQANGRLPFTAPIPLLAQHARGVGHANATPDSDGLVRSIARYEGFNDRIWPYIGSLIADKGLSVESPAVVTHKSSGMTRTDRFGVPFAGPSGTYPTVPYVDVLRGNIADEILRGKTILIGALSSSGLGDTMPVAGIGALTSLPGVEIHANALDALLNDQIIEVPTDWRRVLWISIPIWLALILFLSSAGQAVTVTFAIAALCITANYLALVYGRTGLPLASPLCGVVLAYLLWSWRRLNSLLAFFRQRADALNAVPAGAFEPPLQNEPLPLDSVERRTHALDRAIERLTQLQSLLTEGLWQLPVPVLICRPDGVISQSNAAAHALLTQPTPSSSPGPPAGDVDLLRGVDLPKMLSTMQKIDLPDSVQTRAATPWKSAVASEFTTKQGNVFRVRAAALGDSGIATAPAWVVVLPDVTSERRAQREREQWFGFLSHDLRSPQVTILSLLGLYSEGASNIDIDAVVDGIGSEARRTIQLTESFMDMVEAESGVYRFAPVFAGTVVLDAIDATWAFAQARGLTVTPRLGNSDCSILADSSLLTRAVVNLLNNAIRSSPSGSTIYVCIEANLESSYAEGEAVISVQDEGIGMDSGQIAKVMRADERRRSESDPDAPEAEKGWGVGMSIVHAVVARHGGWLDVLSAPQAGATFLIGLPMTADDSQSAD